ncbi:hypothetical protein RND71_035217 [Anisodus tanguticus]|uniref:Uncharacterized protein n=1 Tax=Anisodus tanguticus TaxID=243964 RepID=A0AAE1UZL0_9SOLA|nr:hypothetical protein RND71_035217 [Anisodus tanguticus]
MTVGIKSSPASSTAESGTGGRMRWLISSVVGSRKKGCMDNQKSTLREAEKAEKVMHLICWGPK